MTTTISSVADKITEVLNSLGISTETLISTGEEKVLHLKDVDGDGLGTVEVFLEVLLETRYHAGVYPVGGIKEGICWAWDDLTWDFLNWKYPNEIAEIQNMADIPY